MNFHNVRHIFSNEKCNFVYFMFKSLLIDTCDFNWIKRSHVNLRLPKKNQQNFLMEKSMHSTEFTSIHEILVEVQKNSKEKVLCQQLQRFSEEPKTKS